ncbi:putative colanic acid polymerase WcaD [Marisediminicola sp. LYQ85]|uniref:putative colanic acid polymerase WcaD n=1 Tax=Marisediminicola sp. LYQ85 TaxID=3391062 RepID=UPI003983C7F9
MRAKATGALLFAAVVFQHFELFQLSSFRVTVGFLVGSCVLLVASKRIPLVRLSVTWAVLIGLSALAALLAPAFADPANYFSTLGLLLVTSGFIVLASAGLRTELVNAAEFWSWIRASLIVVVGLSVGQVITGALGSDRLFNIFGEFQFQNQYMPYLEFVTVPRAQGFFLEPSYNAFVIASLATALLCTGKAVRLTIVLALSGLAAAQSATGLLVFLAIVALIGIRSRPRTAVPIAVAALALVGVLGGSLIDRLASITDTGSSANYRLLAPLEVVADVLQSYPFGLPLGSIYDVVRTYGLTMFGVQETASLDNGIYVVIYYFGWLGLVAVLAMAAWAIANALRPLKGVNSGYEWVVPAWLLGSLIFSGGIVAPEFGIMTWIVVVAYVGAVERRRASGHGSEVGAEPERDHRHLSRSRGS